MKKHIESLSIQEFRNLREIEVDGLGSVCVIHGANGVGKTNLLHYIGKCCEEEYVYYRHVKAYRSARLNRSRHKEVYKFGTERPRLFQLVARLFERNVHGVELDENGWLLLKKGDLLIPYEKVSSGLCEVLYLFGALNSVSDGVLLVEGWGAAFSHVTFTQSIRYYLELADELGVQVFFESQSMDFIDAILCRHDYLEHTSFLCVQRGSRTRIVHQSAISLDKLRKRYNVCIVD